MDAWTIKNLAGTVTLANLDDSGNLTILGSFTSTGVDDFGTGGLKADLVLESTAAAGVTIDGLRIKDAAINPVAGGAAWCDLSNVATGEGDTIVADNLASAWEIRQGTNSYLVARTTNGAESMTTARGVPSGTQLAIGGLAYASIAASTAITGATETETNFDTFYTMPANTLRVGTVVKVRARAVHTATTTSETHTMLLKLGTVSIVTISLIDPADNNFCYIDFEFTVRTVGASGTVIGVGHYCTGAGGTGQVFLTTIPSTVVDTTIENVIAVAIDRQGSATDSDSARLDYLTVRIEG